MIEGLTTKENCYLIELKKNPVSEKKLRSRFIGREEDIKQTLKELEQKGYIRRFRQYRENYWEVDYV